MVLKEVPLLKKRIDLIDDFRAMAMMYVIFIHCLFWFGYGNEVNRSFFLIEMPLFFAITGMAHVFAKMDNYPKYIQSRLERILIPYWSYALIVILLNFNHFLRQNALNQDFLKLAFSWINPFGNHISAMPYLSWAIWFVPVYLIIMLLIPFLKKAFDKSRSIYKFLPIVTLVGINFYFSFFSKRIHDPWQSVFFYCIWIYLGFWFMDKIYNHPFPKNFKPCIAISAISLIILATLLWKGPELGIHPTINMQRNKFPPNFFFLFYTLIFIPFFALFSSQIHGTLIALKKCKILNWFFSQYQNNCYSIFLTHPIAFLLVSKVLKFCAVPPPILRSMKWTIPLVWITVIFISAILGHFFSVIEHKRIFRI